MSGAEPQAVGGWSRRRRHRRFALILGLAFLLEWAVLAVTPLDRADWALENAIVTVFLVGLVSSYGHLPLSRISYTLIFAFLCLHEIGAHYTYARVPYDEWFTAATGGSLNALLGWERNHFDRLVHFLYGLLLAYPVREVFLRVANVRGFWGYFLPLDLTMSTSMMFELFEWGAAELVGGDLGIAYLGTQGDVWDAHKDMALASLGALVAMVATASINASLQRDFAREWADSLRVKRAEPLGEYEVRHMLEEKSTSDSTRS
jgi:putative membrane protein